MRRWQDSDLPGFAAMNQDAEVRKYFPGLMTPAESAASVAAECLRFGLEELRLERIYSWTAVPNERSARVMQKIGGRGGRVVRYGICIGIGMMRAAIHKRANLLATYAFRRVFDRVDKAAVKRGVDQMGLNAFIKHCARLAAATGFISGIGGAATVVVGVPADMLNSMTQQFRVTLAVIYAKTGDYEVSFEDFMAIVAISIGMEAGIIVTRSVLVRIADRLLVGMSERTAARVVPILGAAIGGTTNYLFIKGISASLKRSVLAL